MTFTTTHQVNTPYSYKDSSLLHIVVKQHSIKKMSELLNLGANVNELTRYGETPLHFAISKRKSLKKVKMLVEAGADVNRRDIHNLTPLMHACIKGYGSIASYLVRNGAEVNVDYNSETTPLLLAICATSLRVPLISALLKAKACINCCDLKGVTPLHAIIGRQGKLHDDAKWDVLELLLSDLCDINAKENRNGFTPLHTAVWCDDLKSALILIKAGCQVDIKDHWGRVAMSLAIRDKFYPLVELLLAAGERIPREDWMDIESLLKWKDPLMLERLLDVGAECPKLPIMCRRAFYNHYGIQTRNRIDVLPLPLLIKEYLFYEKMKLD